ncbi:MAG: hypothetical protein ACE5KH_02380 [Candidatus Geothermarchaeales archaeon]
MPNSSIAAVSVLSVVEGLIGLGTVPTILYVIRNRELPVMFGIRFMGGGFLEALGLDVLIVWTLILIALSPLHFVAGYWLWKSLRIGGLLSAVLLIPDIATGIGYAAPYVVLHLIRGILLAVVWSTLR